MKKGSMPTFRWIIWMRMWMIMSIMCGRVRSFSGSFLNGVYQIDYPIQKLVRFTRENHRIVENGRVVSLLFHPPNRRNFTCIVVSPPESPIVYLLVNTRNGSDYILMRPRTGHDTPDPPHQK